MLLSFILVLCQTEALAPLIQLFFTLCSSFQLILVQKAGCKRCLERKIKTSSYSILLRKQIPSTCLSSACSAFSAFPWGFLQAWGAEAELCEYQRRCGETPGRSC